jgi:hypothetical protein
VNEQHFLWTLPALCLAVIGLELWYGRVPLGWTQSGWWVLEKKRGSGRFWLVVVAQSVVVVLLMSLAFSA